MGRHFAGGGDGPCGGLEDGHQETEGVSLDGIDAATRYRGACSDWLTEYCSITFALQAVLSYTCIFV